MTNLALVCLDLPPSQAHPKVYRSFEDAARRWDAEVIWIQEPIRDAHPYWQKISICRWLREHHPHIERVAQLDNDILIRSDCPSLFELVPEDAFGCYSFGGLHADRFKKAHRNWAERAGLQPAPLWMHPNAGLYVYSMATHQTMFESIDWDALGHANPTLAGLPDESLVACYCYTHKLKYFFLPPGFNCLASEWPQRIRKKHMHSFIQHYNGQRAKQVFLARAVWKMPADHTPGLPG